MNKVELLGRLTRDPEIRWSQSGQTQENMCVARYTMAVNRRGRDAGADFISCVAFGKTAEFAEKYLRKGNLIAICGRIQTGSYTNRDGQKVYTTDIVVEEHYFTQSRSEAGNDQAAAGQQYSDSADGFMNIPDGMDEELPFN